MGLDTAIFAVIAFLLLARLWMVLGRRNEDDRERPNPFIAPPRLRQQNDDATLAGDAAARPNEALTAFKALKFAPASLAGGLQQIKDLDPAFDEKKFLQNAKQTFTTIVEGFAKGDIAGITRMLGPDVLAQFQKAVDARRAAGQTMESRIEAIKEVESKEAHVEGTKAVIAVRFVSDQENILRDASGQVIGGDAGKIEEAVDVWSFARDTTSPDPNWLLVETHG